VAARRRGSVREAGDGGALGAGNAAEWSATRSHLLAENRALRERLGSLEAQVLRFRDAQRDKDRLLVLLGSYPEPPRGRPRRASSPSRGEYFRSALLDRGERDGLKVGGWWSAPPVSSDASSRSRPTRRACSSSPTGRPRPESSSPRRARRGPPRRRVGGGQRPLRAAERRRRGAGRGRGAHLGDRRRLPARAPHRTIAEVKREKPLFLELPVALAADPRTQSMVFVLPAVLPQAAGVATVPEKP